MLSYVGRAYAPDEGGGDGNVADKTSSTRKKIQKNTQNTCGHQTCAKAYKYAQICARMCARIKHILTLGTLQDDAIFDAWHSKIFVKRLGLKIRSQLLFSTRFLPLSGCRQCLQTANISQWRSITLVKNCLWWEFSFFDTKKKIDGSYYKWDYSFIVERRGGFLKLFLILGQVVLDAEVAKVGVEKKEGADYETAALPENPKARADHPFPIY